MNARRQLLPVSFLLLFAGPLAGRAEEPAKWPARPSLQAACIAWDTHVQRLIQQHRSAKEITPAEFEDALTRLAAAQSYCWSGNHGMGLATYETIALTPVHNRLLR